MIITDERNISWTTLWSRDEEHQHFKSYSNSIKRDQSLTKVCFTFEVTVASYRECLELKIYLHFPQIRQEKTLHLPYGRHEILQKHKNVLIPPKELRLVS